MAKRKTIQEKEIEKKIEVSLKELGRKIKVSAARNTKISKFQKRHLRDSIKAQVKPYNTINLFQYYYGKYNTPKGKSTPQNRNNITDTPLLNAIDDHVEIEVNILVKSLIDLIVSPIVKK